MALHRKMDALMALRPDVAVISECANRARLEECGVQGLTDENFVWMGKNKHKGLAVFAFNNHSLRRADPFHPTLNYILPVHVTGAAQFNLLAAWAQNASAGITRKHQLGPLRRGIKKYDAFLRNAPSFVAGDLNNNKIWDKPGWRANHMTKVGLLEKLGLVSAYHHVTGETEGAEQTPTHYWRNRTKDGPTYHLDYIFMPHVQTHAITDFTVGTFENWVGNKLSDHVPVTVEIML